MRNILPTTDLNARLRGRVIFLLIALVCLNLASPLVEQDNLLSQLYAITYCIVLGVGIIIAAEGPFRLQIGVGGAVVTTLLILRSSFFPENEALTIFASLFLAVFQVFIIVVLFEFMYRSKKVDREVLYASIVIYLLIANTYAPLHSLLNTIQKGASYQFTFIEGGTADWPQFLYFSYATITTLGFGDIVPVSSLAGMLTVSEAVVGVLYLTMMMARLVGLYAQDDA